MYNLSFDVYSPICIYIYCTHGTIALIKVMKIFITPQISSFPFVILFFPYLPSIRAKIDLFFDSLDSFVFSETLNAWNHVACSLWGQECWVVSFSTVTLRSSSWIVFHCIICQNLFINSSVDVLLGCLEFLVITNTAFTNIHTLLWTCAFVFLG